MRLLRVVLSIAIAVCATTAGADEMRTSTTPGLGSYDVPFYPDGSYRRDVQSPSDFLGFELGARPVTHDEIMRYFQYLNDNFANATLVEYAKSYEGRALVYMTITSEENARNLREIRDRVGKLADPRKMGDGDSAEDIIKATPAVAWMAYGIHGDELSSCDAALQLAYQLIAGTDEVSELIRNEVITCIDPTENPDGRMRWLAQLEQWNSVVPNTDIQSMQHTGVWPYGRGNHYLFDLNRDWFALVHPESRGRSTAIMQWNPQFLLDCHEMGPTNTYLFSPPREPFNPFMISQIHKWWRIYAEDQGAAFDEYGWSYYTREWNEELFPGYGSSWGIYIGAIGMLYEQAGVDGSQVKRPDGTIMTYRETVHHQFISSMANLATTAKGREDLLTDFAKEKKSALDGDAGAFIIAPSENKSRMSRFAQTLERQSIEVEVTTDALKVRGAQSAKGGDKQTVSVPKGALIVRVSQPMKALVQAIMTFDTRIETKFLETERRERITNNRTRLYEATGWSLPIAYNLDAYFVESSPRVDAKPFDAEDFAEGGMLVSSSTPQFGYAFSNEDDNAYGLLARLLERGVKVWAAREPFEAGGRRFERGCFVIRLNANPDFDADMLKSLAESEGVVVYPVDTALGRTLADLGGGQFTMLHEPRIALVGGANVSTYEFGAIWHMLDSRLRYRTTTIDVNTLARRDLRKYNVIILPQSWFGGVYKSALGNRGMENLKTWIRAGGTLIAMGNAAAFCADSTNGLAAVRQKRQVLGKLDEYEYQLDRYRMGQEAAFDSLNLWEAKVPEETDDDKKRPSMSKQERDRADELARTLRPQGAILSVELNDKHWLAYGANGPVPVLVATPYAYVTKQGTEVAARFAGEPSLRLAGLLWPEARARWADTAYATRDRMGSGQIVLFAAQPNFRAYFHGGERLLMNAIFLGPGFGANPGIDW